MLYVIVTVIETNTTEAPEIRQYKFPSWDGIVEMYAEANRHASDWKVLS